MESLYKKKRCLNKLFNLVIDSHKEYTNEEYIMTLDLIDKEIKRVKKDIEKLRVYYIVNNDW